MAKSGNTLGRWAFLIGVILAVLLGLFGFTETWVWVLVLIGLIIGLLNVADEEVQPFLLSGVVLIIAAGLGNSITTRIGIFNDILQAILAIFVPATIIVAIKNVFTIARH